MKPRQYRPDLSVKYAPRVPERLRKAVNDICRMCDMPEADVLRYSFEAAVLTAPKRLPTQSILGSTDALDHMITIRTSRRIHELVNVLWQEHPNTLKADILRSLLKNILRTARKNGMAHVLRIREQALWQLSGNI